jgi:hypothetical protein
MRPGHWLALGSAIAGCTAALGFYLVARETPADAPAPRTGGPRWQTESATKRHSAKAAAPGQAGPVEKSAARAGHESATPETGFRIQGNPPAGPVTEERAWFASAERVEREANRELESLREALELSPYQEQRIFGILARRSSSWMPGMDTGGSHGADAANDAGGPAGPARSVTDEILPLLDEDQQQALIDEELDRRAWWEEILPQLLPPEFPAATAADDPAASLPGAGDTKAYEGPTETLEN